MKFKTLKYLLNEEQTINYFCKSVDCGNCLGKMILKSINFSNGEFYTFLPNIVDRKKIYLFEQGGIMPLDGITRMTVLKHLDSYIYKYLEDRKDRFVVLDNYHASPKHPLDIQGVTSRFYSDSQII